MEVRITPPRAASIELDALATRLATGAQWSGLRLAQPVQDALSVLLTQARSEQAPLTAVFAGPDASGRTMAAEALATELGRSLYRVDLGEVVSKYIGETEKNLDRLFEAAKAANAVLLFDEADALFGKRSGVSDSHDRYANLEVADLLQRLENHYGLAILASNFRQDIDNTLLRRFFAVIEFPLEARRPRVR